MIGIFMPGRLGSERLPNKLILPFGKSCLWDIACKKLNELPDEYEKVVLVKDQELIDIAKKYKNIKILIRSEESNVSSEVRVDFKDIGQMSSDYIMFLNPCISTLPGAIVSDVLRFFEKSNKKYLESVKSFKSWLYGADSKLLFDIDFKSLNTKAFKDKFEGAHAFRIFPKKDFLETGKMSNDKDFCMYEISELEAVDVDTELDYKVAKVIYDEICS